MAADTAGTHRRPGGGPLLRLNSRHRADGKARLRPVVWWWAPSRLRRPASLAVTRRPSPVARRPSPVTAVSRWPSATSRPFAGGSGDVRVPAHAGHPGIPGDRARDGRGHPGHRSRCPGRTGPDAGRAAEAGQWSCRPCRTSPLRPARPRALPAVQQPGRLLPVRGHLPVVAGEGGTGTGEVSAIRVRRRGGRRGCLRSPLACRGRSAREGRPRATSPRRHSGPAPAPPASPSTASRGRRTRHRGGLRAENIRGGQVHVGDPVGPAAALPSPPARRRQHVLP